MSGNLVLAQCAKEREERERSRKRARTSVEAIVVVDEDNDLYTFSVTYNIIRNIFKIHEKDVLAICHHPHLSLLASYSLDGTLNIFNYEIKRTI
mgnify:CR=1 FL=1